MIQAPGGSKEDRAEGFKYGGWMGPFFGKDKIAGQEMEKGHPLRDTQSAHSILL